MHTLPGNDVFRCFVAIIWGSTRVVYACSIGHQRAVASPLDLGSVL
jgi:hypothetical protein